MAAQRIDALRAALEVAPDDVGLRRMLCEALESAARLDEVVPELKHLIALQPVDPTLKVWLARCYVADGQPGAARILLDELERQGDMTPEGWRIRGALLGAQKEESHPEAVGRPEDGPTAAPASEGSPPITFADVGGMEALKEQIRLKIILPMQQPDLYAAYGKRAGGGLLLYGPPGCGKTYLARATAGELGAAFIAAGVADVLEKWIGASERNLRSIFANARAHRPTVLFFDEVDALAADRATFQSSAGRSVINQFLAEMDGVNQSNEGVLILAATNAPWHVDAAFRRPGRFDEVLFVPPPDAAARRAITRVMLRDKPVSDIDVERIASATDGFSGADIRGLVERAVERKLQAALKDGRVRPLATGDLLEAIRGFAPTTREWFATVRNYLLYANQSGLYDPVRPYLEGR